MSEPVQPETPTLASLSETLGKDFAENTLRGEWEKTVTLMLQMLVKAQTPQIADEMPTETTTPLPATGV